MTKLTLAERLGDKYVSLETIREKHAVAQVAVKAWGVASITCLEAYCAVGEALELKKEEILLTMGHGNWLTWLATNIPEIEERTMQRYMKAAKLAKTTRVSDLDELPTSMRQLLALGEKKEDAEKDATLNPLKASGSWVSKIGSKVREHFQKVPATDWKPEEKEDFVEVLKEFLRFARQLKLELPEPQTIEAETKIVG